MSNENIYSTVQTDPVTLKIYDEICGAAFVNLYTLSKDSETIDFLDFNPNNMEHLFLLGVARGVAGAYNKKIRVDVGWWQLRKLNRGIDKDCRVIGLREPEVKGGIYPNAVLNFMRKRAVEATNNITVFHSIYREFYERKR